MLPVVVGLILVALTFVFINGFHDAANSIATVVSTGVLRPYPAVAWAACFNFVAFAIFKLHVAATVGNGVMVALECKDRAQVDRIYALAMKMGAKDEGPPGQRMEGFYAGYFRDPDGNKLNAFIMG